MATAPTSWLPRRLHLRHLRLRSEARQHAPMVQEPLRIGPRVQQAKLIEAAPPVYPPAARNAGVSGDVLLDVTIGKDGSVVNTNVLKGDAMLTPAAVDAVRQWKYQPTLLNSQPIEVVTQVTVNFTLM